MTPNAFAARSLGIALAALVVVLALAGRADAAEKAIWGPSQLPSGGSAFGLYAELGIDTFQVTIQWNEIALSRPATPRDPADPAYRWPSGLDAVIAAARRRGINIALLVHRAPGWSNGERAPIWGPDDPGDFADFLAAAALRYPLVHRWMIWSEPNKDTNFQPNVADDPASARAYAVLLDAAYGALKEVDRRNRVIGGMTWTGGTVKPADFVRWMRLPNRRPPRLDWFGHNPFPFRFPDLGHKPVEGFRDISDLDTFGQEINKAYGRPASDPIPLWLSEYSVQTDHGSRVFALFTSADSQARYLTAGYRIADRLGARVAGLGWLGLLDEPPAADSANWGVMTFGLKRKPSFAALAAAPSRRASPFVSLSSRIGRRALRTRGIAVALTPRETGRITVQLRRDGVILKQASVAGRRGSRRVVRLRHTTALRALLTVVVRSPRGATVRRSLRVGR